MAFTIIGLIGGAVFLAKVLLDLPLITVSDDAIRIERSGESFAIPRSDVSAVFLDEKKFVVLGADSAQRLRTEIEKATPTQIRNGMKRHSYP